MGRSSRLDAPGVLHHIMIRGIERRKIFQEDGDRENFLDRLGRILAETSPTCLRLDVAREPSSPSPENRNRSHRYRDGEAPDRLRGEGNALVKCPMGINTPSSQGLSGSDHLPRDRMSCD
jgi:hypothetical protein